MGSRQSSEPQVDPRENNPDFIDLRNENEKYCFCCCKYDYINKGMIGPTMGIVFDCINIVFIIGIMILVKWLDDESGDELSQMLQKVYKYELGYLIVTILLEVIHIIGVVKRSLRIITVTRYIFCFYYWEKLIGYVILIPLALGATGAYCYTGYAGGAYFWIYADFEHYYTYLWVKYVIPAEEENANKEKVEGLAPLNSDTNSDTPTPAVIS
ncbi:MAG: hypothetical protein MJ252_28235 [archaeon]|nr:hypothetical protein [archaeon]